jgi:hypothetical protein
VVVSTDFIKAERRREEFVRTCPELVIVDEAHTCADPTGGRGAHLRHRLLTDLAADRARHLILVTATPHSGKEEAFRALLGFLDPSFEALPEEPSPEARVRDRRRLAQHLVQRRRGDIRHYVGADTQFPDRQTREETYGLSAEYRHFFHRILAYCRESVRDPAGSAHRQRVRWWAALALLRAIGSSPAAAAATLRERAKGAETATLEEADEVGRRAVMDLIGEEDAEGTDVAPGADAGGDDDATTPTRRRLLDLAREAERLHGDADRKLAGGIRIVRELVTEGHNPIVFCRFIDTAEYLAAALRTALPSGVEVAAVTGTLPPAEREARVTALGESSAQRVLVATDCLSEGINLQDHFDAVVHYDLSWNPTRHEQREGRVDRFGQPRPAVRVVTYYGSDNPIDGIVLSVLLRKHRAIRDSLGISVPVPVDTNAVLEAILEGLLLRGRPDEAAEGQQALFERDVVAPRRVELFRQWESAADRERRSRTVFAQETIKVDEVARELHEVRAAIGSGSDVARFTAQALRSYGAAVTESEGGLEADLSELPRGLRDVLELHDERRLVARFDLPVGDRQMHLTRTHPLVEGLAAHVLDTALDPLGDGIARRAGVVRTGSVSRRTTVLLLRLRFDLITHQGGTTRRLLAEEARIVAFAGTADVPAWLPDNEAEGLLAATPDANVAPEQARQFLERVHDGYAALAPHLTEVAQERAAALLESHRRVRESARQSGVRHEVEPKLPADILGAYVFLPLAPSGETGGMSPRTG